MISHVYMKGFISYLKLICLSPEFYFINDKYKARSIFFILFSGSFFFKKKKEKKTLITVCVLLGGHVSKRKAILNLLIKMLLLAWIPGFEAFDPKGYPSQIGGTA